MLVRFVALLIDAWVAARGLAPALRRAWLSAPGELVARGVLAGCGIPHDAGREVTVDLPGLPDTRAVLVEDPRTALYLDHVPIRPTAQTIGRHILARSPLSDAILRHELEHVRQWARLGPFFLPAYVLASGLAIVTHRDRYWGNAFEVAARAREAEGPRVEAAQGDVSIGRDFSTA